MLAGKAESELSTLGERYQDVATREMLWEGCIVSTMVYYLEVHCHGSPRRDASSAKKIASANSTDARERARECFYECPLPTVNFFITHNSLYFS